MEMAWSVEDNILRGMDGPTSVFLAGSFQAAVISFAVIIAVGVVICLFGLKLVRILSALIGLAAGVCIGIAIASVLKFTGMQILIASLVCALVLAVLCAVIRKFGIFVLTLISTMGIVSSLLWPRTWILAGVCAAVSLIMSVLSILKTEAVVTVVTGISGGLSAGMSIAALIGLNEKNWWIGYVISAALALIGIWFQFMMQSRKIGKKEKVYSRQVREEVSMESEVERARLIMEDDEEDGEGEDDSDIVIGSGKKNKERKNKKNRRDQKEKGKKDGKKIKKDRGSSEDQEDDDITFINEEL